MSEAKRSGNRLSGVRLGELERSLLQVAPAATDTVGMLIEDPTGSRATRQGYLRAAKKLERVGLITRRIVREATRASDPRRTRPTYERGRFVWPATKSRRHSVRRVLIWITPFGDAIRRLYAFELVTGRSIRWTDSKIRVAENDANRNPSFEDRLDEIQERLRYHEPQRPPTAEAVPRGVGADQLDRWHMAIAIARRQTKRRSVAGLWPAAEAVFQSDRSTGELRKELGGRWRAPTAASPLRLARSPLGLLHTNARGSPARRSPA